MHVEQKEGYTIIDRRGYTIIDRSSSGGGDPCRVCCGPDCHTQEYNKPTMDCIRYLRSEVSRLEKLVEKANVDKVGI